MTGIYKHLIVIATGLTFSFIALAESQTKQQPQPAKTSINAEYRIAKNKCSLLSGSAEDVCLDQARSTKTKALAKAELRTLGVGDTAKNKASNTKEKSIDQAPLEEDIESAVTEIKPIESDEIPPWKDIFKGYIRIVA